MPLLRIPKLSTHAWRFIPLLYTTSAIILTSFLKHDHNGSNDSTVSRYFGPGAFWAWVMTSIVILGTYEGRFYFTSPSSAPDELDSLWKSEWKAILRDAQGWDYGNDIDNSAEISKIDKNKGGEDLYSI
ncbi:hypothetical protein ASPWEDRAFT_41600 [Aspergillus wentii DTO 134E9]|uniref:Uncharacterized protein n=1 Tax=Aspergillus wentii DTO 134E9 TaxID=1073089 RepID=A0A1L9RFN2_ASPWE|nr:uncharacterized protein ASPWEDRAFT_41600 [Aspergillus wentii DTO 134E9]KAI9925499.1 hypothetical protein MW887_005880 [Aspergillus wentii]OJJ33736.1 hypothetical protein ASPWEDRAFT_41600 [Aspergillus wentii DTO 134E9]